MKTKKFLLLILTLLILTPISTFAYVGPALSFSMLGTLWAFLAGLGLSFYIIGLWLFKKIKNYLYKFFNK